LNDSPERRRIGLLGGTFDPPHLAHLVVAEQVRDALDLDEVRLLVTGDPWMKHGESHAEHRVPMARLAVEGVDGLAVDDRETRRAGATYTADTLRELTAEFPDVDWFFVVGQDAANHLPQWRGIDEAMHLATFVVVPRPDVTPEVHGLTDRLVTVDAPLIGVSSTTIRERVAHGRSIRFLVPEPVIRYIAEHGLYGAAND
jgi:nicotinate-nucleotide adenylyltransferase